MTSKLGTIAMVLKQPRYAIIAVISSVILGIIYYVLTMSMLQEHLSTTLQLMPEYIIASIALSVVISGLGGVNVSLVAFKMKSEKMVKLSKKSGSTILGSTLAAFTPGCPACTTPLIVVLGAVGGLSIFPLLGLELKFISVAALVVAMFWITKGLQKPSCCSVKE